MLDKAVLRYNDDAFGDFLAALVYYGGVNLVVSSGTLLQLLSRVGARNIENLIDSKLLTLIYDRSHLVIQTSHGPLQEHRFQTMQLSGDADGSPIKNARDEVLINLKRNRAKFKTDERSAQSVLRHCEFRSKPSVILENAKSDVMDKRFITRAVPRLLSGLIPTYVSDGRETFDVVDLGDSVAVETNLDFETLNQEYSKFTPPTHSTITTSYLLSHFLTARGEMFFWGDTGADIWIDAAVAEIMTCKVDTLEKRISGNRASIDRFEETIFSTRSFDSCQLKSHVDFAVFVDFLLSKQTEKFKSWLGSRPDGADVLREYDRAVIEKSALFSSLPFRTAKLLTFSGLGFAAGAAFGAGPIGAMAGGALDVALSAGDEFLLSKIDTGWKPSQWDKQSAKPLLKAFEA